MNLLEGKTEVNGGISPVEGIVQKTIVVPNIDNTVEVFDGIDSTWLGSYFLFKNIL